MQNRVQETTTTGGTGTITLAGAVTGYITFAAGFTTGDVLFYTIDNGIGEWEIGIGTLVTTGTLSRTTVIASSNSGALVNFSSGTKRVFCSAPTRSLVPDQDSKSGYVLTTDGTNPSWTQTLNSVNIGNTTAGTGAFTTLSASSTVSGTGFSNYLASPPAIGGSSPAAGNFTNLGYTGTLTGGTGVINIGSGQIVKNASGVVTIGSAISLDPTTANALVVNSSGNVGLGVSPSNFGKLEITGNGNNLYLKHSAATGGYRLFVLDGDSSFNIDRYNGSTFTQYLKINASGDVLVTGGGGLGYGTGSGGTVTQATSKSTAVTINKCTGKITMNSATLNAGSQVQFAVISNLVVATDVPIVTLNDSNGTNYNVWVYQVNAGSFYVNVRNITGSNLSDALVLNFAVIKGVIS
jgi:hypothetical protein